MDTKKALDLMHHLTAINAPFSFSFFTYNKSKGGATNGIKTVECALLRPGLPSQPLLVAYKDLSDNTDKFFYYPLLLSINNVSITV